MGTFDRWRRGPIRRQGDGTFVVELDPEVRAMVGRFIDELRELLGTDDPSLARLFPPPYGDDEERNQGYAVLAGAELRERRLAALDVVSANLDAESLTEEQLEAWMRSINDIRLVLGTMLGIEVEGDAPAPDSDAAPTYAVYEFFGVLLETIVQALSS